MKEILQKPSANVQTIYSCGSSLKMFIFLPWVPESTFDEIQSKIFNHHGTVDDNLRLINAKVNCYTSLTVWLFGCVLS